MSIDPVLGNSTDRKEETSPSANPHYQLMGGEQGLFQLVEHFYGIMDADPYAAPIRAMHPADLTDTKGVLRDYLSGWLGGPNRYEARHGHPRLRQRHMRFSIGDAERDQWMYCMEKAISASGVEVMLQSQLLAAFLKIANHLRNRQPMEMRERQ